MKFLTPDENPTGTTCRVLYLPDDPMFVAAITTALEQLTLAYNWEKYGTLEPEEAAAALSQMFDDFCFQVGTCAE